MGKQAAVRQGVVDMVEPVTVGAGAVAAVGKAVEVLNKARVAYVKRPEKALQEAWLVALERATHNPLRGTGETTAQRDDTEEDVAGYTSEEAPSAKRDHSRAFPRWVPFKRHPDDPIANDLTHATTNPVRVHQALKKREENRSRESESSPHRGPVTTAENRLDQALKDLDEAKTYNVWREALLLVVDAQVDLHVNQENWKHWKPFIIQDPKQRTAWIADLVDEFLIEAKADDRLDDYVCRFNPGDLALSARESVLLESEIVRTKAVADLARTSRHAIRVLVVAVAAFLVVFGVSIDDVQETANEIVTWIAQDP